MKDVANMSKVWFRFSKSVKGGEKVKLRWEKLSNDRFEDFLDFQMKYYVKHEATLVIAGIYKNPKAMEEYRQIVRNLYKKPSYHTAICCLDDDSNKIIGFDSLNLYRRGEMYYPDLMQTKTAEMKRFMEIFDVMNNLCPVPDILSRYGVEQYFDDAGLAIHPEYRGYGFTTEVALLRYLKCKENDVPLTGAWMTSTPVQNITKLQGWDTIFEASSEEMGKLLKVNLPSTPPKYVYKVKRQL